MDKQCAILPAMYEGKLDVYPVPEFCMQVTSLHLFVLEKKSVYTEAVKVLMSRMVQAGLVQRRFSRAISVSRKTEIIKRPAVTLQNLFPVLLLLFFGSTVGFLVFVFEWLLVYVKRTETRAHPSTGDFFKRLVLLGLCTF